MGLVASLLGSIVGFVVGAIGIYVGGQLVADHGDFTHALVTAFVATLVTFVVGLFFGWIPLFGPLLGLIAYVGVLNMRFPGGWVEAAIIGVVAWLASTVVNFVVVSVFGVLLSPF
jgi:hypothetical protein